MLTHCNTYRNRIVIEKKLVNYKNFIFTSMLDGKLKLVKDSITLELGFKTSINLL